MTDTFDYIITMLYVGYHNVYAGFGDTIITLYAGSNYTIIMYVGFDYAIIML